MEDVLSDIISNDKKTNPLFSKWAFGFAIASVILVTILVLSFSTKMLPRSGIIFSRVFAWVIDAAILAGTFLSIMSIVKKEKLRYYKITGIIINFIFFSMLAVVFVFVIINRYSRF